MTLFSSTSNSLSSVDVGDGVGIPSLFVSSDDEGVSRLDGGLFLFEKPTDRPTIMTRPIINMRRHKEKR